MCLLSRALHCKTQGKTIRFIGWMTRQTYNKVTTEQTMHFSDTRTRMTTRNLNKKGNIARAWAKDEPAAQALPPGLSPKEKTRIKDYVYSVNLRCTQQKSIHRYWLKCLWRSEILYPIVLSCDVFVKGACYQSSFPEKKFSIHSQNQFSQSMEFSQ